MNAQIRAQEDNWESPIAIFKSASSPIIDMAANQPQGLNIKFSDCSTNCSAQHICYTEEVSKLLPKSGLPPDFAKTVFVLLEHNHTHSFAYCQAVLSNGRAGHLQ